LPSVSHQQAYGAMMSRGGGSKHKYNAKGDETSGNPKPNINSINSG